MRNNSIGTNRMSKLVYIILAFFINLFLAVLFFCFFYNEKLFKFKGFFSFIYIICVVLGLAITYRKHRTIKSAVYVVIVPFGIYCLVAYNSLWTIISGIILFISFIYFCVQIFRKPIPKNKDKSLINIIRVKKMIKTGHSMLGFYSAVLVVTAIIASLFSGSVLAKNMDDRSLEKQSSITFSLDDWKCADADRKFSYAEEIVDYECDKLNIKPLTLTMSSKMPDSRLAYYSNNQSKIVINKKHLNNDSVLNVCKFLAHECFHAAQYSLIFNGEKYAGNTNIENYILDRITTYKVEFKDYKEYDDSNTEVNYQEYFDYYTQSCESDSRKYGEIESLVLYKIVMSN